MPRSDVLKALLETGRIRRFAGGGRALAAVAASIAAACACEAGGAKAIVDAALADRPVYSIQLRNRAIDTESESRMFARAPRAPKFSAELSAALRGKAAGGPMLVLVQFSGRVRESGRLRIEAAGARVCGYVPVNALLVEAEPGALGAVSALPSVQWLGLYRPGDKLQPGLPALSAGGHADVRVITTGPDSVHEAASAAARLGGAVFSATRGVRKGILRARLPAPALELLADEPAVEWIEADTPVEWHNNVAAEPPRMNSSVVWTNHGLTGRGQVVCVADTGLDTGNTVSMHPDFTNRLRAAFAWGRTNDWSDAMGHGTHVAGSVLGNGSAWSNGLFKGQAPGAELVMQSIADAGNGVVLPDDLNDLFAQSYAAGARVQNDSWGESVNGQYTAHSRQVDEFVWAHPDMLICFSAGNSGVDGDADGRVDGGSLGAPASAKNALTVGAAATLRQPGSGGMSSETWGGAWGAQYPARPIAASPVSMPCDGVHQGMAAFSSRGPCMDGRVKPDIVAPGTDIVSCRSRAPGAGVLWGTGEGILGNAASNHYVFCGGTSMSSPLCAGAAALARQYLVEARGFANPSAALVKALMLAGARSLSPGQYGVGPFQEIPGASRPNSAEGWGHVDLGGALFPESGTNVLVDGDALNTDDVRTYAFQGAASNRLCAMLVWSDYPSCELSARNLVNDLDLVVITPSGAVLHPNGGAGFDRTNNVEGVDVGRTEAGVYTVLVIGSDVPMGPQPFALALHAGPPRAQAVEGLEHIPNLVTNLAAAAVRAQVLPNGSGVAAVSNFHRVNGGAWQASPASLESGGALGLFYRSLIPGEDMGALVEYCVKAYAADGAVASSATNSYTVRSPVIHVAAGGAQAAPYDTWDRAFTNLAGALAFAIDGMEVRVTNGVYREGATIVVTNEIRLSGAHGAGHTILDAAGSNVCLSIEARAIVDGFTITGGFTTNTGGGVRLANGELRNSLVVSNEALTGGGGMALSAGTLASNCVLRANSSYSGGGALVSIGGEIRNSLIEGNRAEGGGGVCLNLGGAVRFSAIRGNAAAGDAGGVMAALGGTIEGCVLEGNHAGHSGGGAAFVAFFGAKTTIRTVLSANNTAAVGGGLYVVGRCDAANLTIASNAAAEAAGLLAMDGCALRNLILADNAGGADVFSNASCEQVCAPAGVTGNAVTVTGLITNPPLFLDPAAGDFRLDVFSPCRDAGTNADWMTNALDAAGCARVVNGIVDLGAYELGMGSSVTITAEAGPHGSIQPSGAVQAPYGGRAAFALLPDAAHRILNVTVDGAPVGAVSNLVLTGLAGDHVVAAWFALDRAARNDFDGDRASDLAVFDPASGEWYVQSIARNRVLAWRLPWGWPGAAAAAGDFDGDRACDIAAYDASGTLWYVWSLARGCCLAGGLPCGAPGAEPAPGDYDGDGADEVAAYEAARGLWYACSIAGPGAVVWARSWGWSQAAAVPGDYDNSDAVDLAVFGEDSGLWYVAGVDGGVVAWAEPWGGAGFVPVAADYDADGCTDLAVYDPASGLWYVLSLAGGVLAWAEPWGFPGVVPVAGDYDGDGAADRAVFDPASGSWYVRSARGAVLAWGEPWGFPGAVPVKP